jgi:hypothetical protein
MVDEVTEPKKEERPQAGRRGARRPWLWLLWAVILVMGLLAAYGVAQWYSQNPLKFRITDVRLEGESRSRIIKYELHNTSFFPVQVLEYIGICQSQDAPAFPFQHTFPETMLIKPGAVVSGEFRMYSGLKLPEDYTKYIYRWEPTSQPRLKAMALWLREKLPAKKGTPSGSSPIDTRFSSFIHARLGEHDGWAEDFYRRTAPRGSRDHVPREGSLRGNFGE